MIDAIASGAVAIASPMTGCAPDVLQATEILPTDDPHSWIKACESLLGTPQILEDTRLHQARAIGNNSPTHHSDTIWQAVHHVVKQNTDRQRWK